jgi:hypothetical protein
VFLKFRADYSHLTELLKRMNETVKWINKNRDRRQIRIKRGTRRAEEENRRM